MGFCFFVCMKEAAPHEADAFSAWHEEQTSLDRESGIAYDDISICPEELKRWYEVMLSHFPAMNGRDAESSQLAYTMMLGDIPFVQARLEAHLTNYAVKSNLIFGECSWVLAKEVYELARTTAAECGLVFFDYSFGRVYFSETDVLRLPYEDVEYEKYSLSLPLIIPMDYAFSWIEGAQGYIYGKPRDPSPDSSHDALQPFASQKKVYKSAWLRWFANDDGAFASHKDMWKIVGTLTAILVVGSVIINTTTLKAMWMPATIAVCIAITMLGVALVTSLLHYYKTGHFFAE